ncbi:uncharacterized protein [Danio rerio]|uniref:Uncharacterized protein n=1 Tax=Danio rerio TaxID=7955 RepID=A0AC58GBB9_DANRE
MADHGFPVTRTLVKILATGIIKESCRTETTTVNLERGPIHGATPKAIEGFFKLFEALYTEHKLEEKPHLIFNCDETGFGDKPRSREKVLCQTGRKHKYQQQQIIREHITIHCCVNAGESIPPFIIYPDASQAIGWMDPPNALYGVQEKGYMDSELFFKWLCHFDKYAPEERPIVLIMDQHETHVSKPVIMFCRENKIEIICLPAHTTHILQPLDIAVFNPLKTACSTMASRMSLVRGDVIVGKKQFSSLLKHVYPTAVTAQNIKAGFRKAGIFPLSWAAVDTTQVVRVLPSTEDPIQSSTCSTPPATPSCAPAMPSCAPATPSCSPATQSCAPATPSNSQTTVIETPCPTCHRVAPKNYLLAAGVIPESLANGLMSPALERKEKVRRRIPLPARVITSEEYFDLPPGSRDDTIDEWVQCDLCLFWFHLECIEVEEVPETDWLYQKCCLST